MPEGGGSALRVALETNWHSDNQNGCAVGRGTVCSQKEASTARRKERGRIEP